MKGAKQDARWIDIDRHTEHPVLMMGTPQTETTKGYRRKPVTLWIYWCRLQDSNPPPDDYKSTALPDELSRRKVRIVTFI